MNGMPAKRPRRTQSASDAGTVDLSIRDLGLAELCISQPACCLAWQQATLFPWPDLPTLPPSFPSHACFMTLPPTILQLASPHSNQVTISTNCPTLEHRIGEWPGGHHGVHAASVLRHHEAAREAHRHSGLAKWHLLGGKQAFSGCGMRDL